NMTEEETYQKYVRPAIEKIETEFDSDLTVQELAASVYVTPQYLSRLFTRFLGCSTHEYLTSHRINEAKRYLLANPKMEIQEIARQVGFGSTSHFIAVFKKKTGITPLSFRSGRR
ncbi:MAG: AraC family transcriptional regulator, partial [Lachnospiraceae bacterium]|nr:AraC family transcriptional regulator [Lachnospiraceae bacterium]